MKFWDAQELHVNLASKLIIHSNHVSIQNPNNVSTALAKSKSTKYPIHPKAQT